jgi:hypothetical protein
VRTALDYILAWRIVVDPFSPSFPVVREIFDRTIQATKIIRRLRHTKLRIVIIGCRASGETTVLTRLRGRALNMKYAATSGESLHVRVRYKAYDDAARKIMFSTITDLSGERSAWPLWDRAFTRDRPNGIIFVVDGAEKPELDPYRQFYRRPNFQHQKSAMQFFIDFLGMKDRSWLIFKGRHRKARDQIRAVMLLYNKTDIWHGYGYTKVHLMTEFNSERMRLDRLVPALVEHECSALHGTNFYEAMGDFIAKMVDEK